MKFDSEKLAVCEVIASAFVLVTLFGQPALADSSPITILNEPVLLGDPGQREWEWLDDRKPHSTHLALTFQAKANAQPRTLLIRQDDVKQNWPIKLNDQSLGYLFAMEAQLWHAIEIAPGMLRDGANQIQIGPVSRADDVIISQILLTANSRSEFLGRSRLKIHVRDSGTLKGVPCRITIVDGTGALAPLHEFSGQPLAVRPGVVYTANGTALMGLQPGQYTVYASRGFEYGLDSENVTLNPGEGLEVELEIGREVDTTGYVACDTHTHTFTLSKHGDATLEERVITLAGEGIELPIATDHNVLADYSEAANAMGVRQYLTPVIGDEVTTQQAHFNVFPIEPNSRIPDFRILNWPALLANMRSTPGVRVIILNHPRNVHNDFQPFALKNFNPVTGETQAPLDLNVDAIELLSSSAQQSDLMLVFNDWFTALNYGHRMTGLGSSDVHDVSRYIIGQGRTYIACEDSVPGAIDVSDACRNLKQGHALISMGLLADMTVDDRHSVGDLATSLGARLTVEVEIAAPSWIRADRVVLYANGINIRERSLLRENPSSKGEPSPLKRRVRWTIEKPKHDIYLVAMATGPGVTEPYWPIPRPYQPTSRQWIPRVAGATNPIWIDADGDETFTPAREYAQRLWREADGDLSVLFQLLNDFDQSVASQVAGLGHASGLDITGDRVKVALGEVADQVRIGFEAFAATIVE